MHTTRRSPIAEALNDEASGHKEDATDVECGKDEEATRESGALLTACRLHRPVGHKEAGGRLQRRPEGEYAKEVDGYNVVAERAEIVDVEASEDAAASRVLGGDQRIVVVVVIVVVGGDFLVIADILFSTCRLGRRAASFDCCRRARCRERRFAAIVVII